MDFRKLLFDTMCITGIDKKELAKRAGITVRSINYYLNEGRVPKLDTADKLLKVLGVSLIIGK